MRAIIGVPQSNVTRMNGPSDTSFVIVPPSWLRALVFFRVWYKASDLPLPRVFEMYGVNKSRVGAQD